MHLVPACRHAGLLGKNFGQRWGNKPGVAQHSLAVDGRDPALERTSGALCGRGRHRQQPVPAGIVGLHLVDAAADQAIELLRG